MQHAFTLVVITLLQLCRAEIPKALPEWYAANLINDAGFQPKPITEIFTTQPTFSSRNPIIVASTPSTSETDKIYATSPITTRQATEINSSTSTEETTQRVIPLQENRSTSPRLQEDQRQILQLLPQPVQILLPQQSPIQPSQRQPNQETTGQPNYFLIYQQSPLSIQQYPQSPSQSNQNLQSNIQTIPQGAPVPQRNTQEATRPITVTQPQTFTTEEIKREETPSSTISTTQATTLPTSAFTSVSRNVRQEPILSFISTPTPLVGTWRDPRTTPGPIYFSPPISSRIPPSSTLSPCLNRTITGWNPGTNTTNTAVPVTQRQNRIPALTIRVKAPRGSITNISINPSTTTKKPSTRRSQRRKGNNYNNCVDSCRGKKDPICAAPLAVIPIDPNNLKGFPSICHLACHNSFRKNQPYEKIMDGRCSKLRTRIRTFDKSKLKREELNKAQYTVLSNDPETVVQVIQNDRSDDISQQRVPIPAKDYWRDYQTIKKHPNFRREDSWVRAWDVKLLSPPVNTDAVRHRKRRDLVKSTR